MPASNHHHDGDAALRAAIIDAFIRYDVPLARELARQWLGRKRGEANA